MSEEKSHYPDVVQAQAALDAERQARAERAHEEIKAALAKYKCDMVAVPQITPEGRVVAVVQVIAR